MHVRKSTRVVDRPPPPRSQSCLALGSNDVSLKPIGRSAHEALTRLSEAEILVVEHPLSRRRKGRPRRVFAAQPLIDLLSAP